MTEENKVSARRTAEEVYDESNICPLDDLLTRTFFNHLNYGIENLVSERGDVRLT